VMNNIENWKTYIFSLPEQVFFEIMRNYLGDVKTPFNKHDLVDKLTVLLSRDETAEKVLSLIDRSDAEIITAISILGSPTVKELFSIFKNNKSYYDFYLNLLNLEERMLVFSEEIEGESRISVSALYRSIFEKRIIDPELLIPSCENIIDRSSPPEIIWLNDSVIISVFSFLLRQGAILKIDGSFRKKVIEELKDIFPDKLTENTDAKIELMRMIIKRLKLAVNKGDFFQPDIEKWMELGKLSVKDRIDLFLGASVSDNYTKYGSLISAVADTLLAWNRGFSFESLKRIVEIISLKNRMEVPEDIELIIEAMTALCILREESGIYYPENIIIYKDNSDENVNFILQPNFDIITNSSITFDAGILLSLTADVKRYSDVISLSLTRESFIRALEAGITGEEVTAFFEKYTGHGIPQNIRFSLKSWEKEFRSIELFSGIVLTADVKKRKIIDNSGHFKENLVRKLGDGVYLVKPENLGKLKKALFISGIEHIPVVEGGQINSGSVESLSVNSFVRDSGMLKPCVPAGRFEFSGSSFVDCPEININEFNDHIESTGFTAEQKKIIKERIERKIILFPSQITKGSARFEKNEAKGLDYSGKIRLAEQALENRGYLLEIVERKGDEQVTSLVKPESIDKSGKDVCLEGIILPDEEKVSIRIGKASIVKKIKTSLFMK